MKLKLGRSLVLCVVLAATYTGCAGGQVKDAPTADFCQQLRGAPWHYNMEKVFKDLSQMPEAERKDAQVAWDTLMIARPPQPEVAMDFEKTYCGWQ